MCLPTVRSMGCHFSWDTFQIPLVYCEKIKVSKAGERERESIGLLLKYYLSCALEKLTIEFPSSKTMIRFILISILAWLGLAWLGTEYR